VTPGPFILAYRSLGAFLLIMWLEACRQLWSGDFDPNDSPPPFGIAKGIVAALAFLVLAWWLLFR